MIKMYEEYERFLETRTNVTEKTLSNYTDQLKNFPEPDDKKVADYLRKRIKNPDISNAMASNDLVLARMVFDFLGKDRGELENVKVGKPRQVKKSDLYTKEELREIFENANNTRDRAVLQVLYESACRASEFLSMTFENTTFFNDGTATSIIDGKTGERTIFLFESVPTLRSWLDVHPHKEGKIWVSLRREKNPLTYSGLYQIVKRILKDIDLYQEKRHILHMFRHTRITELVRKGVRGSHLHKIVGWKTGSNMESVYVHLSTQDAENEMRRRMFGLKAKEEPEPIIQSKKCENCEKRIDPHSLVCPYCNTPREEGVGKAMARDEKYEEILEMSEKINAIMDMLLKNKEEK